MASTVCFLFIAQPHQMLHALPTAVRLADLRPDLRIELRVATEDHQAYARELLAALGAGARLPVHLLGPAWLRRLFAGRGATRAKAALLLANARALSRFDVIVVPERTSLLLQRFGLRRQRFIHTDHGAGDRAVGYEPRLARFDLLLLAGEKQRTRLAAEGLLRAGHFAVVGYPKFDMVDALAAGDAPLFDNRRRTILYNPHFHPRMGSWERFALPLLAFVAGSDAYNLILAPHIRLFDGAPPAASELLDRFRRLPNIHIDLGSAASIEMRYTNAADLYVGDVSSQVYEFLRTPRPCLFLNAHGADWQDDPNYLHWQYGPVIEDPARLAESIAAAFATHDAYRERQAMGFAETFDLTAEASSLRAARAILEHVGAA
jgi:hypothetical protein